MSELLPGRFRIAAASSCDFNLVMSDEELLQLTLIEIEDILNSNGKSLREFSTMPYPNIDNINLRRQDVLYNKLILDELNYNHVLLAEQHKQYLSQMTIEQRNMYDQVIKATNSDNGHIFFLYGYGGTGKIFLWRTLLAALRSKGEIVLTVASVK
ncbi:uncharacterized protein LOC107615338 [Arachis ipaensis]|uniref:uncharacterized protein LOC107615338 n=1 Tax=Arachis ipaensis TaxID=130454 RepID=UPI0007AF7A6A|nr:uncharacterized protein LOC107615338 [Arachis ipaensis]